MSKEPRYIMTSSGEVLVIGTKSEVEEALRQEVEMAGGSLEEYVLDYNVECYEISRDINIKVTTTVTVEFLDV